MGSSFVIFLIAVLVELASSHHSHHHPGINDDTFIELINTRQKTWKAGRNFDENIDYQHFKRINGQSMFDDGIPKLPVRSNTSGDTIAIVKVKQFDCRKNWPYCPSIKEIWDQGSCGSCWVIAPTSAMTDKICIWGMQKFWVSPQHLLSCCYSCGFGCGGGKTSAVWTYWQSSGLYGGRSRTLPTEDRGFFPYNIPSCNDKETCTTVMTPTCTTTYDYHVGSTTVHYDQSKFLGQRVTRVQGEAQIIATIFNHGPVSATFEVYEDFLFYKSGVYIYTEGRDLGGHAVKLIGWGVEKGVPYWLAANSWGKSWGDKGYFKIVRGQNHLRIEDEVVDGVPLGIALEKKTP